jgi:hypothetical protein
MTRPLTAQRKNNYTDAWRSKAGRTSALQWRDKSRDVLHRLRVCRATGGGHWFIVPRFQGSEPALLETLSSRWEPCLACLNRL